MKAAGALALLALACPAQAGPKGPRTVVVRDEKARRIIEALQFALEPEADARGDYDYEVKKLDCKGATGMTYETSDVRYRFPTYECTRPPIKETEGAKLIIDALNAAGIKPTAPAGAPGRYAIDTIETLHCVVHSTEPAAVKRFECRVTYIL